MPNPFNTRAVSMSGPGVDYLPVSPDDLSDLPNIAIALYVENAGAVSFRSIAGHERTVRLGDHGWILCGVDKVLATGTTAAGIHAVTLE